MAFWSSQTLSARVAELTEPPVPEDAIDCNAITLRVGREIYVTPELDEAHTRTKQQLKNNQGFLIPPGQFAYLMTEEKIRVPKTSMAFISVKTTFKMKGLVNVSGFHADPGWEGPLIFAVFNAGPSRFAAVRSGLYPVWNFFHPEVDVLSGGRLRLGIGVGWNHVEYQSLGAAWNTRGAMQAEQIAVLRRLWTEDLVTFNGRFHPLESVNILPAPVQKPIPIWFGGSSDAVIRRCARLGDGWMPILSPDAAGEAKLAMLRGFLQEFGRDPATFGIEAWIRAAGFGPDAWAADVAAWKRLGAGIAMLYPTYDLPDFASQIDLLQRFKEIAPG